MLDIKKIKKNFPVLSRVINGKKLVYLDNSATSQKPQQVIDSISNYYQNCVANVHRGVHTLSDESTDLFEKSKKRIAQFFGSKNEELILVRNTTEAINGVAYGWGEYNIQEGDVILTSVLDHHSNIVVWQELAKRKKAQIVFIDITQDGNLDLEDLKMKLEKYSGTVKLVAFSHVSNALGSVAPVSKILKLVKEVNSKIRVLVDGAQSAPHMQIDFAKMEIDFFALSGHKMLGPMGVGGLLVKKELLQNNEMKPWLFGGGMIAEVHTSHTNFHEDLSERFIAGTPDVASIAGLAAACDYLSELGMVNVLEHDLELVQYALEELSKVENIKIVGPIKAGTKDNPLRVGSVSFLYKGVHAHDVAQVLDSQAVAVRSGHHCTMPLHTSQDWIATTRASFQVYNSFEDIDALVAALKKVQEVLL